jgi:hypothetical protein
VGGDHAARLCKPRAHANFPAFAAFRRGGPALRRPID